MKKILLSSITLFAILSMGKASPFLPVKTEETKQEISSNIKSVIIYLSGAEITHNDQVTLNAGRNKIGSKLCKKLRIKKPWRSKINKALYYLPRRNI